MRRTSVETILHPTDLPLHVRHGDFNPREHIGSAIGQTPTFQYSGPEIARELQLNDSHRLWVEVDNTYRDP